jgi:hypothetical protein
MLWISLLPVLHKLLVQIPFLNSGFSWIQSIIGGQPLLIVGVSEPITLIYGYCYTFGKNRTGLGPERFLAWMAWVCLWVALMIFGLAATNACDYTDRFTRLPGEMFGMLIAVLFMQQAIKGTLGEFRVDDTPLSVRCYDLLLRQQTHSAHQSPQGVARRHTHRPMKGF